MKEVQATVLLILSAFCCIGQIPDHIKTQQPQINALFVWNGLIVVEKHWQHADRFYACDTTKGKLIRLIVEGDTVLLALAETNSTLYAVTKRDQAYFLFSRTKKKRTWKREDLIPISGNIQKLKLLAIDDLLILVTPGKVYSKRENSKIWHTTTMDSLLDLTNQIPFTKMPEHTLLTPDKLYLGFDQGEWGGELWEVPLTSDDDSPFQKGTLLLDDNIRAIAYSSRNVLWIATGLAHLSGRTSGIYRYEQMSLKKVLWSQPSLSLNTKTDLSAFCLKNSEEPFFAATELGIFKIRNEALEAVLNTQLSFTYRQEDYSVNSRPVGMHIDEEGTIYLAQRSLGIYLFRKTKDAYTFRQITFD